MTDIASQLTALRGVRAVDEAADSVSAKDAGIPSLDQFRADFKAVFRHLRAAGLLSEIEAASDYAEASAAVRSNQGDEAWMRGAMRHFREMAAAIERDQARAERIRDEVRTARAVQQEQQPKKRRAA